MPVVLRTRGFRVEFYASDGDERRHVHVKKDGKHAKIWIEPEIQLAFTRRYSPHEVNQIIQLIEEHYAQLLEAWNGFFRTR